MSELKVGAGKACIDPADDMYPMVTHFGVCESKYDSCYCRAVAIFDGQKQLLLVVFDLSDMPCIPDLWGEIAGAVGVSKEDIVLAVTHNHSSPNDSKIDSTPGERELGERYKQIELQGAVDACKQALASMRPAVCGYGECSSEINVNRNYQTRLGQWVEAPNDKGYSDKTLAMIKFTDCEGKLIAAVLNHGTHANHIFLQKDSDGKRKLSGNFPGITCRLLEEYYGNDSVVVWTSSAAGDQNPVMVHGAFLEKPSGQYTQIAYPDGTGYLQMEVIGHRHAVDALKGLEEIHTFSENMKMKHVKRKIFIPAQKYAEEAKAYVEDDEHPVSLYMELLLLGDIAVICVGAELYSRLGRQIKELSPYKKTLILTHTHYHIGYIFDRASADIKLPQAFGRIKPGGADEAIMDCVKEMFREIAD